MRQTAMMLGHALVAGACSGEALALDEPRSLWGGVDPVSGSIIDGHHPQRGALLTGRILAMRSGRGSSSSSGALLEMVRLGTHPTAVLLAETDPILALGAIVALELYSVTVPVVVLGPDDLRRIGTGERLRVAVDGTVEQVVEAD
jgi:predicted aconitase with swiveling domain